MKGAGEVKALLPPTKGSTATESQNTRERENTTSPRPGVFNGLSNSSVSSGVSCLGAGFVRATDTAKVVASASKRGASLVSDAIVATYRQIGFSEASI
jgi:hypothetical protein